MRDVATQLGKEHPNNAGSSVSLVPLLEQLVGEVRPALLVLLASVTLVLLIMCANIANLLLAKHQAREREIAVRSVLGASRFRIVRQLLAESVLLFSLAGMVGVLLARWLLDSIVALAPREVPRLESVSITGEVLGFTALVSLFAALVFGLLPGLRATHVNFHDRLAGEGRMVGMRHDRSRLRSTLVVLQVGLSLVLLIGAGLLIRSFLNLNAVDPGFDAERVLTLPLTLPTSRYPSARQQADFFQQLVERSSGLPEVDSVAGTTNLPLSGSIMRFLFRIPGSAGPESEAGHPAQFHAVTPGYFRTLGIPVLSGREFAPSDDGRNRPVVIVNDALARRFWPGQDPIGKLIMVPTQSGLVEREIVGVVGDVRHSSLATEANPEIYVPLAQNPWSFMTLVLRTETDPSALVPGLRDALRSLDPHLPAGEFRPLEHLLDNSLRPMRFRTLLMSLFAFLGAVLAALGIYGVVSYSVTQRSREIGLRMALGASRAAVLSLILRESLTLALMGVGLGLAAALVVSRFLSSLVFGVSTTDAATLLALPVLVLLVALLASYLPARRASKVDPMVALRCE